GVHAHLGQVLVREAQRVGARAGKIGRRVLLVVGDHLLAAAAVAGDRRGRERPVGRYQSGGYKRPHREREGGGVAAGVGDAFARPQSLAVSGRELGHAVGPRRIDAVRGGGVDHAGLRIGDERGGFLGGGVGQAKEGDVGGVETLGPRGGVLAQGGIDLNDRDVGARGQPFEDLQSGGALLAIDKYLGFHDV